MIAKIIVVILLLLSNVALAAEKFVHVEKQNISSGQLAKNFGINYSMQWAFYYLQQHKAINEYGSFRNWRNNIFSPHFDRDKFETNIIQHSLAGASYYLFYRSRGYSETQSFIWSNISTFAFEFTIENYTERPSYQDLALTPTLGTALGFLGERVSAYFHEKKVWPGRLLGFLFNPYSVVPGAAYEWRVVPEIGKVQIGARVEWHF